MCIANFQNSLLNSIIHSFIQFLIFFLSINKYFCRIKINEKKNYYAKFLELVNY